MGKSPFLRQYDFSCKLARCCRDGSLHRVVVVEMFLICQFEKKNWEQEAKLTHVTKVKIVHFCANLVSAIRSWIRTGVDKGVSCIEFDLVVWSWWKCSASEENACDLSFHERESQCQIPVLSYASAKFLQWANYSWVLLYPNKQDQVNTLWIWCSNWEKEANAYLI